MIGGSVLKLVVEDEKGKAVRHAVYRGLNQAVTDSTLAVVGTAMGGLIEEVKTESGKLKVATVTTKVLN